MFIFPHMGSLPRQCSSKCSTTQRCLGPIWVPKTWTTWDRFHLPGLYFWDQWFWASKCNMICWFHQCRRIYALTFLCFLHELRGFPTWFYVKTSGARCQSHENHLFSFYLDCSLIPSWILTWSIVTYETKIHLFFPLGIDGSGIRLKNPNEFPTN